MLALRRRRWKLFYVCLIYLQVLASGLVPTVHTSRPLVSGISSVRTFDAEIKTSDHVYDWSDIDGAIGEEDGEKVRLVLDSLKSQNKVKLWNSAQMFYQRYSLNEMMINTGLRGDIIDKLGLNSRRDIDRIALILGGLIIGSFVSSTSVIQLLPGPEIVRFTLAWVLAFTPYYFLGLGIATPEFLQKSLVSVFRLNPKFKERLVRHEAGHFLAGYLCGMPIASYQTDAVTNAVQFFDSGRRFGRIPEADLLRMCIVSLGGVIAEIQYCGHSEGGAADLAQLNSLLQLSEGKLTSREKQDRVRYGAVMAHTYLNTNKEAFNRLAGALGRGASVGECLREIEMSE